MLSERERQRHRRQARDRLAHIERLKLRIGEDDPAYEVIEALTEDARQQLELIETLLDEVSVTGDKIGKARTVGNLA